MNIDPFDPYPLQEGAICYFGKFGSTRQYAEWIAEASDFPVFNLKEENPDLSDYDFLILGSAVYIGHLAIRHWLKDNWETISDKPILLFSVSGTAPGHPDLNTVLSQSLDPEIIERIDYFQLRGKLDVQKLPWITRSLLKFAAWSIKDAEVKDRLAHGFDHVDKEDIRPILEWTDHLLGKHSEIVFPLLP